MSAGAYIGIGLVIGGLLDFSSAGSRVVVAPPCRTRGWKRIAPASRPARNELAQLRAQLTETGNAAQRRKPGTPRRKECWWSSAYAGQGAGRSARGVQSVECGCVEADGAGVLRLAEQSFGKLQESAKGDLAQRQESIKTLVEPLKQQLETYQKRLQQSEAAQSSTLGEVKKQLELLSQQSTTLAQETQQFRLVLHSNQARGKWARKRCGASSRPPV